MYIPSANRVQDRQAIHAFLRDYGFATLVTNDGGHFTASHLPVLFDEDAEGPGALRSHMARANPQWQELKADTEVLCIFRGPHGYISPSWYVTQYPVPTWNYAAIHVYGVPTIVDEVALREIVFDTTDRYESAMPNPWKVPLSEAQIAGMLKAIVGFKIDIVRVEAKFKLGQNRAKEDQQSMIEVLQRSPDCGSRELAQFIKTHVTSAEN